MAFSPKITPELTENVSGFVEIARRAYDRERRIGDGYTLHHYFPHLSAQSVVENYSVESKWTRPLTYLNPKTDENFQVTLYGVRTQMRYRITAKDPYYSHYKNIFKKDEETGLSIWQDRDDFVITTAWHYQFAVTVQDMIRAYYYQHREQIAKMKTAEKKAFSKVLSTPEMSPTFKEVYGHLTGRRSQHLNQKKSFSGWESLLPQLVLFSGLQYRWKEGAYDLKSLMESIPQTGIQYVRTFLYGSAEEEEEDQEVVFEEPKNVLECLELELEMDAEATTYEQDNLRYLLNQLRRKLIGRQKEQLEKYSDTVIKRMDSAKRRSKHPYRYFNWATPLEDQIGEILPHYAFRKLYFNNWRPGYGQQLYDLYQERLRDLKCEKYKYRQALTAQRLDPMYMKEGFSNNWEACACTWCTSIGSWRGKAHTAGSNFVMKNLIEEGIAEAREVLSEEPADGSELFPERELTEEEEALLEEYAPPPPKSLLEVATEKEPKDSPPSLMNQLI